MRSATMPSISTEIWLGSMTLPTSSAHDLL
jgi:hypothetical protein